MTEYDLFVKYVPMIAEMAVRSRELTPKQYAEWKREALGTASDTTMELIGKVFIVIDAVVKTGEENFHGIERSS